LQLLFMVRLSLPSLCPSSHMSMNETSQTVLFGIYPSTNARSLSQSVHQTLSHIMPVLVADASTPGHGAGVRNSGNQYPSPTWSPSAELSWKCLSTHISGKQFRGVPWRYSLSIFCAFSVLCYLGPMVQGVPWAWGLSCRWR
jgi:hypothetical protein